MAGAGRGAQSSLVFDEQLDSLEAQSCAVGFEHMDDDPESILARRDDERLVNEALRQLPPEFREILVLRELEDLSYKEIAGIAGIPIGTVMSRLARARRMLADCLRKRNRELCHGL